MWVVQHHTCTIVISSKFGFVNRNPYLFHSPVEGGGGWQIYYSKSRSRLAQFVIQNAFWFLQRKAVFIVLVTTYMARIQNLREYIILFNIMWRLRECTANVVIINVVYYFI